MSARPSLSKKLRFDIFKRDGFVCQYCGSHPPQAVLEVDHIHPVAGGGGSEETNLITACFNCNRGKGASALSEAPRSLIDRGPELAQRAAMISELEEQITGYESAMRMRRERVDDDAQSIVDLFGDRYLRNGIPYQDFQSIRQFIEKLGLHEVTEASCIAVGRWPYSYRSGFKYFCGVCWNKIKEAA